MTHEPACPVDLHYPEPDPVDLDLPTIVGRGRRIRRRQRFARVMAVVIAGAAVASIGIGLRGATFGWFPDRAQAPAGRPPLPIDPLVALNPPANGKLTLISNKPRGWITVAWGTRAGVCYAIFAPAVSGSARSDCWSRADIPGPGHTGFGPLLPVVGGFPGGDLPEMGLVTTRAVRVTLTYSGHSVSAGVVQVPMGNGRPVGVYLVWLPPSNSNIDGAAGYDRAGGVVASHGPGM